MSLSLIQKYNIPGPRYTSYPTVPFWDKEGIELEDWKNTIKKSIDAYTEKVNAGTLPIFRGHLLTRNNLIIRKHILNLMCNLETTWEIGPDDQLKKDIVERLSTIIEDGLIEVTDNKNYGERRRAYVCSQYMYGL